MPLPPTLPRFISRDEADTLSKVNITPPHPHFPPSPPTSRLPDLDHDSEGSELMYSRGWTYLSASRSTLPEEEYLDLDDLLPRSKRPRQQRDDEQSFSDSDSDLEKKPRDSDRENKRAKYDTKPPPLEHARSPTMAKPTLPSSPSTRENPRTRRVVATPDTKVSSTSTPSQPSPKPRSQITDSRRQSSLSDMKDTPSPSISNTVHADTEEEEAQDVRADEDEDPPPTDRNLRKRTLKQTNPFKYDKHEHKAKRAGKGATTKKIETAVQKEIGIAQQPPEKKARHSSSTSAWSKSTKSNAKAARASSVESDNGFDPSRVVLRVRLDGFDGGAAPVTLIKCSDIDLLMKFMTDSWAWKFGQDSFSHAVVSFPWLSNKFNIILRPGMADSFDCMVELVKESPTWEDDEEKSCQVDVTVFLQRSNVTLA